MLDRQRPFFVVAFAILLMRVVPSARGQGYHLRNSGKCQVPISNKDECRAAINSMGDSAFPFKGQIGVTPGDLQVAASYPPGCFQQIAKQRSVFHGILTVTNTSGEVPTPIDCKESHVCVCPCPPGKYNTLVNASGTCATCSSGKSTLLACGQTAPQPAQTTFRVQRVQPTRKVSASGR